MGYVWLLVGYVAKVTILLLYFNKLMLWLRGYVIFVKIKIIFFYFKIKVLYETEIFYSVARIQQSYPQLSTTNLI